MNLDKYLSRINYTGDLTPNLDTLTKLQYCHLINVPFENLDIHYNKLIELSISKFYNKIVKDRRGGFCYELNGLFSFLLNELGFTSKIISAKVFDNNKQEFGEEYNHLAIIVTLNRNEYLVDVGFGEFSIAPLKINQTTIQNDARGNFLIENDNNVYTVSIVNEDEKVIQYKFTNVVRHLSEFSGMCKYHQTSPDSHFTQKKLISQMTEKGRITITGDTLKITQNGKIKTEQVFAEENFGDYLLTWFNINEQNLIENNRY